MGRIGWSATVIFFAISAILATYEVQGLTMPQSLFITIIIIMLLMAVIACIVLVRELLKALSNSEWRKRRIYTIQGIPKAIALGERQIPIVLRLGATRYIGRAYVYFVKAKGSGTIVADDLVTVSFDTERANYSPGIRVKGAELPLILKVNAKSQWKGWLKIGFTTEAGEIPYVHFPIAVG